MQRRALCPRRGLPAIALLACACAWGGTAAAADRVGPEARRRAAQVLAQAGVKGGLIVHVGCRDGRLTAALRANDRTVVQGLDADETNVQEAREHVQALGLYGSVTVDAFDGKRLPYVDNLVNLLVLARGGSVPREEVVRVLAPRGVACFAEEGEWRTLRKPWPEDLDEWPHFLHGPDNNAVAQDTVVGPPRHMQWLAGPRWTRHHHADKGTDPTVRAVVSARGRLFYMVDEAGTSDMSVPSRWMLVGRDGFSGVLLWKRPIRVAGSARRLELVWRTLLAGGDEVYAPLGPDQPLSALDAATGEVVRTCPGTEAVQEAIKDGNSLFVLRQGKVLLALRADTGQRLWQWEPGDEDGAIVPLTLAAADGKVFVKTARGVVCLSADAGESLWRTPLAGPQKDVRLRYPRERLLVHDGVVLCSHGGTDPKLLDRDAYEYLGSHPRVRAYQGRLAALSATDGHVLWRSAYMPGLESMPGELYICEGRVWLGPDFAQPRDLHTGAVERTRAVIERLWTDGHHYRCYPGKATCRYVITGKRGVEMIDLAGEAHSRNNWVRGTCRVGVTPCNGLLYAPPHSCGCYMEAKLVGFWALAARREAEPGSEGPGVRSDDRIERGPAFGHGRHARAQKPDPAEWRTYRGDAARSGATVAAVPPTLKPLWRAQVGDRLTSVTVAGGRVFVAEVDAHTVHALDAGSGEALWRFTAGGRVDSPPTLWGGLALFGGRDGWVYCLRAADGALVWRFLAAPETLHAVACGQVESLWPVHGSVLVHDGVAYAAAGRSSYLDGGIVLYGLDPVTGRVRCTARLASRHAGALAPPSQAERSRMAAKIRQNATDYKTFLAPDHSDAFSMDGARTDVMTADGGAVFMRHLRFDRDLARQEEKRPHLFSTSSFLDGAEHHRSYLVLGTGDFRRTPVAYPWIVRSSLAVPYGLLLAFDREAVWGVRRVGRREHTDHYAVFGMPRPDPGAEERRLPDFAKRTGRRKPARASWSVRLPFRPRAMVRGGDVLLIGGEAPDEPGKGVLRVVSCTDGETLRERPLASPPVWDGMAAARGQLTIALRNGTVACLGSE